MILLIIEWISTIIFLIAGIVNITKHSLKAKVKIFLNLAFTVANGLWMVYSIMNGNMGFVVTGALYVILGIIGTVNFTIIYNKEKKRIENKDGCDQFMYCTECWIFDCKKNPVGE